MLRDYQQDGVGQLREKFSAGAHSPLYVLPTGGGKTFVFCFIAKRVVAGNRKACILVHRQELLSQCSRSLLSMGVQHGIIAPGYKPNREPIQVASVQTLNSRIKKMSPEEIRERFDFDLIVVDEAHHAVAGSWRNIVEAFPYAKLLGVTATPCRTDGRGLGTAGGGVFDALVMGPSIGELIRRGYLVRPVVFAPPARIDVSKLHMRGGDFNSKEAAAEMDKPSITGDAVAHYSRLAPFKPAIAFCASVEHAHHVAEQFRGAGFSAQALDGKASDAERRSKIAGLASGEIHVLTSCDLISEGTDIPVVEAAILLRPTASLSLYLQQVGRALRTAPGKTRALILDHVGNCLRHGMPDDDRYWSLDGIERKKRGPQEEGVKLRQCPSCYAFHEHAMQCPECGHTYETAERGALEVLPGELRELTDEEKAQIRERAEQQRKAARREQGKAQSLEELIELAKQRGYKNPAWWAKTVLRSRQHA